MPVSTIIALFAAGLAVLALGSPLGAIPLVLGAIAISLKLGMPVVTEPHPRRNDRARDRRHTHPF